MHIGLNCYLEIQLVGRRRLLTDDHALLSYAIPQIHLLESEEVGLAVNEQVLRLPQLHPILLEDRRSESLRMEIDATQHVVVDHDIREDTQRIRINSIDIERYVGILDALEDQLLVLLRLPAILPVSLDQELFHHGCYPLLVQRVRVLLHGFGHLILFLVF